MFNIDKIGLGLNIFLKLFSCKDQYIYEKK